MSPRVEELIATVKELIAELEKPTEAPPKTPGPTPFDSGQDPPPHPHNN